VGEIFKGGKGEINNESDPMKSLSVRLGVVLIGLAVFSSAEAWGANWKSYGRDDFGEYYYDAESMDALPNYIVSVWTREISSQKSIVDMLNRLGIAYSDLGYIDTLWEVDCIGRKFRAVEVVCYSKSNSFIDSPNVSGMEWKFIIPDSMLEVLSKAVCK